MLNYKNYLMNKLMHLGNNLFTDFQDNYKLIIYDEQEFAKKTDLEPNAIHIVIKYLQSDLVYSAKVRPIQIYIMSEEDGLQTAKLLFDTFATTYNYSTETESTTLYKFTYSQPSVLNNFNPVDNGYRSMLVMLGSIVSIDNIVELSYNGVANKIHIGTVTLDVIQATISYSMTPDTQAFPSNQLARSIKSMAITTLSLVTPCVDNGITQIVRGIMNGSVNGDTSFSVNFNLGATAFSFGNMKVSSAQIISAPNELPSLQIGFTL